MVILKNFSELHGSAEQSFLKLFFERLNQAEIQYAVMRNYEPLPYSTGGSDLDLIVIPEDEGRLRTLLYEAIRASMGVPIGIMETVGFLKVFAIGATPAVPCNWWGVCIDINFGLFFKGHRLIAEGASWPVDSYRNIAVLPEGLAGLFGVLKEVLYNGIFPSRYAKAARQAAYNDWPCIEKVLAPLGKKALAQFHSLLLSEDLFENHRSKCQQLRHLFFRQTYSRFPIESLWRRIGYEMSKVRRYMRPSGIVIAILGTDGAGKTTLIEAILPALQAATHNAVFVKHLRPDLLPPLARLKGNKVKSTGPVTDPHGSMPSSVIGSLLRLIWLTVDYIFGYWLLIRPKIAKLPAAVIFDRYAHDIAIDPRRYRINLPEKVVSWFSRMAPKPHIIFCLHGDPVVIAARKKELPVDETRRQLEALKVFARSESSAVLVETDRDIMATRDKVLKILCDFLHRRVGAYGQNG